jgi:hypothetical protein
MTNEQILIKVQKMLALSKDNAATEAEAALAAERAMDILARHNLSVSDIKTVEEDDESVIEQFYGESKHAAQAYYNRIAMAVARLYFCDVIRAMDRSCYERKISVMGKPGNVAVCMSMLEYLHAAMDRLVKEVQQARKKAGVSGDRTFIRSYRLGIMHRLVERLNEMREAAKAGTFRSEGGSTLPALSDAYRAENALIKAYMREKYPHLGTARSSSYARNSAGYSAGRAAGDRVGLHGQLNAPRPNNRVMIG